MTTADIMKEIMAAYHENRKRWIKQVGDADDFDEWFTSQVKRVKVL